MYYWRVAIRDHSGNQGPFANATIIIDTSPPVGSIVINNNETYTTSTPVMLRLSATDLGSGVDMMRFSNDGIIWTTWESYTTTRAWTLTDTDGIKTVYVQYRDAIGNISGNITDTIILDTTGPTGSITVNGGAAYTNSAYVDLELSAIDAGSGLDKMRFSNDGLNWTTWEPYATSKAWALTSGDGNKTVYVQYSDKVGFNSIIITGSIILDSIPPIGLIIINGGAPNTDSILVRLTLYATDSVSGVDQMRFSNSSSSWSTWEPYTTSKVWTLTSGNGPKTVSVQYRDGASNGSVNFFDTINYTGWGNRLFLPFVHN